MSPGKKLTFVGACISIFLGSVAAHAACSHADLAGEWQVYSNNTTNSGRGYRVECSLNIAKDGTLGYSICRSSSGKRAPVENGRWTLASAANCSYRGSFLWMTAPNQITQMTLSNDKRSGSGAGKFSDGQFTFTMIKAK